MLVNQLRAGGLDAVIVYEANIAQVREHLETIPIVLPPLVIGLSLLLLCRTSAGQFVERFTPVTYAVPGIILAQLMVACAFAVRTMRTTFDHIRPRQEQVALTLGCSRSQVFLADRRATTHTLCHAGIMAP